MLPKKTTLIELVPNPKKPLDSKRQRIVQTEAREKLKEAPNNAFLGEHNQQVDRETVSRRNLIHMGHAGKSASSKNKNSDLSRFGVPLIPMGKVSDQPQWATPGTRPEDYVTGLKESDMTALNTREYIFYGYFQRIRERLDRAWVPLLRERLAMYYQSGRTLASDMDHTTRIIVTLNETGEITRVQLVGESGIRDLDDAAVSAFNKAGPFPNPPKGMIDANHEVKIPWDFILKT